MGSITEKFKVMLVDDEPIIRQGLRVIIDWSKYGFVVCGEAANGREALEKIDVLSPDLIIVDIRMPEIDGLEFLETLRLRNETAQVILLTGYSEFEYAQKALNLGALSYILKPIDEEELKPCVTKAYHTISQRRNAIDKRDKVILDICWGEKEKTLLNMLCMAVDFNNREEIGSVLRQMRDSYRLSDIHLEKCMAAYLHVYFATVSSLNLVERLGERLLTPYNVILDEVYGCRDLEQLQHYMYQKLCTASDQLVQLSAQTVVNKITAYVDRNFTGRVVLDDIARSLNYTPAYLGKLFKQETGMRFSTYLTNTRLAKAKQLLEQGKNVSTVAELVGYKDVDYFHSKFKRRYGVSPSTFKKSK